MLTFLFSALTMTAVGKAAIEMVEEVRRQLCQPDLMLNWRKPFGEKLLAIF